MTLVKLFSASLGTDVISTLPLHLRLEIRQLRDRHVDVAAADVRGMPEVCRYSDHAPVYSQPTVLLLLRSSAAATVSRSRGPRLSQTAREALDQQFCAAGHL